MGAWLLELGCDATTVYTRSVSSLSHTSSAERIGLPSMRMDVALNCTNPWSTEFSFISLALSSSTASLNWNWCRSELREAPSTTVFAWALTVVRNSEQSEQVVSRCTRFPILKGILLSCYQHMNHSVSLFNDELTPATSTTLFSSCHICSAWSLLDISFSHSPETNTVMYIQTFRCFAQPL